MCWYRWKWGWFAWSLNRGGGLKDSDGQWRSLFGTRLYYLVKRYHAMTYWKARQDYVLNQIQEARHELAAFYWLELIRQEMWMYEQIGEPVNVDEFTALCDRRGFSYCQRLFLAEFLEFIKLGKAAELVPASLELVQAM